MTSRTRAAVVLVTLASGFTGCDDARPVSPTAPTATSTVATTDVPPPTGSILMKGTVSDTAFRHLPGARVEVLDGPNVGMSVTTDSQGEFTLTGRFDGTTRFRASSDGHLTAVATLQPFCLRCNPAWWIHFTLEVPDPPVNVAGTYALTVVADSTCTMLPSDARARTFTATIPPVMTAPVPGGNVVAIASPTVLQGWNAAGAGLAGDYLAFWFETLVEQLAKNRYLSFSGQAAGRVDPSNMATIDLPFAGIIQDCVTKSETGRFEDCFEGPLATRVGCESNNHRLILTRR